MANVHMTMGEYEDDQRYTKFLSDRVQELTAENDALKAQLSQIRDIVAPTEESEDGSESGSSISGSYATISEMVAGLSAAASPSWGYVNIGGSH